jgi:hypothetical protein
MTKLMEDIEGAEVIVDDILVWGATIQEHDERFRKDLDRARQCNLKLSKSKCKFRKDEVEYVGHIIMFMLLKLILLAIVFAIPELTSSRSVDIFCMNSCILGRICWMKVSISDLFTRTELFVLYELITNLEFLPVFPSFFFL